MNPIEKRLTKLEDKLPPDVDRPDLRVQIAEMEASGELEAKMRFYFKGGVSFPSESAADFHEQLSSQMRAGTIREADHILYRVEYIAPKII